MIGWIRQKLADRRARKEADRRAREVAVRSKLMHNDPTMMSPTGVFEVVKKSIDASTEASKKARETAQKILEPKK
jgi:hypothetical protein